MGRTADYLSQAQVISRRFTINMLEFQSSKNEGKAMKKQAPNHVNRKLAESDRAPAKPTGAVSGAFDHRDVRVRRRKADQDVRSTGPARSNRLRRGRSANFEMGPVAEKAERTVHNDRRCTSAKDIEDWHQSVTQGY
jgi:hypothetical protein